MRRELVFFDTVSSPNILGLTILLNKPLLGRAQQSNRCSRATVIQCKYTWALYLLIYKILIKVDTKHTRIHHSCDNNSSRLISKTWKRFTSMLKITLKILSMMVVQLDKKHIQFLNRLNSNNIYKIFTKNYFYKLFTKSFFLAI